MALLDWNTVKRREIIGWTPNMQASQELELWSIDVWKYVLTETVLQMFLEWWFKATAGIFHKSFLLPMTLLGDPQQSISSTFELENEMMFQGCFHWIFSWITLYRRHHSKCEMFKGKKRRILLANFYFLSTPSKRKKSFIKCSV